MDKTFRFVVYLGMSFLIVLPCAVHSQSPDILENKIMQRIINETSHYHFGGPPSADIIRMVMSNYSISGLSIQASNVRWLRTNSQSLPVEDVQETALYRNCSSVTRHSNRTIRVRVTIGQDVTLTDIRTETDNAKVNLSVPLASSGPAGSFGSFGAEQERSVQINLQTQRSENSTREDEEIEQINREVPPYTALWVRARRQKSTIHLPFLADFIVDGTVTVRAASSGATQLQPHSYRISAVLSSQAQRIFHSTGRVHNISATNIDVDYVEQSLDQNNSQDCPPIPGLRSDAPRVVTGTVAPRDVPPEVQRRFQDGATPSR